jgi:pimeloyl-ACP methyl ester carboxylesterase
MWTWDPYVPVLADAGYRVLRYDMYGRGESAFPTVPHDRDLFGTQLLELLDQTSMRVPVNLVGYSFGGATALNFTARHPDKVRSLALLAPAVFYEHDNAVVRILRMPLIGPVFLRLVGLRKLRSIAANALAGTPRRSEHLHLFGQQLARPGFLHAFLSFARSDALGDYRPLLSAVGEERRRVLLIWGAADAVVPAQDMADVRSSIEGILYSELEGGDHAVVFSAPNRVMDVLLPFLGAS